LGHTERGCALPRDEGIDPGDTVRGLCPHLQGDLAPTTGDGHLTADLQVAFGTDLVGQGYTTLGHALPDVVRFRGRFGCVVTKTGRVDPQDGGRLTVDLHARGDDGQDLFDTVESGERRR